MSTYMNSALPRYSCVVLLLLHCHEITIMTLMRSFIHSFAFGQTTKKNLQGKVAKAFEQLCLLKEARNNVQRDLEDKQVVIANLVMSCRS